MNEQLVTIGGELKALGDGKIGGYLVRFGDADTPDLTGDYFTADTDFDLDEGTGKSTVLYHHGLDAKLGRRKLGRADLRQDEVGVWMEAQLKLRDDYDRAIYGLVEAGKMGLSSGTAPHLVEREHAGAVNKITRWPLGLDASITPIPAEPRTSVMPLKSYLERAEPFVKALLPQDDAGSASATATDEGAVSDTTQKATENKTMDNEQVQAAIAQAAKDAAEAATKAIMDKLAAEPVSNPMTVEVKSQPAQVKEKPDAFGSFGEQLLAVKHWYTSGGMTTDTRLINIKAIAGANETVGSDGGFLLQPTFNNMFLQPMHDTGVFTSRLGGSLPVAPNSNSGMIYGVDETSRATGSRWGGIRGYRVAEGETITGSKPKFREINWRLHKYAVLVYATDELLADSTQLQTIVNRGAAEELDFMVNNDVLWGTGAGMLAGVMNSAALIQVAKETGQDAATINYNNLTKMWARLDKRSKSNAFWFINTDVTPQLDKLALPVGLGGLPANYITYGADGVMRIKGRPVVETEFNETLGTLGDILLMDPSQYLMWEKDGVQMASSIHVQFLTDQSVFRFIYRVDGQPAVSQQLTPFKGTGNTVSPFVALATRS